MYYNDDASRIIFTNTDGSLSIISNCNINEIQSGIERDQYLNNFKFLESVTLASRYTNAICK
jgi:hypothetical protein